MCSVMSCQIWEYLRKWVKFACCVVVEEFEIIVFLYSFCIQIEVNSTFTAISGLVFYYEEFLAVKFIAYSLASS